MKKKLLSLLIIFCLVIPFGLTLVSCDEKHTCEASTEWTFDDTHHWKTCTDSSCTEQIDYAEHTFVVTTIPATLAADGSETKTCETCGKTITTTLPMLVQTRDEQIAVLSNAVKSENYAGSIEEVTIYKTNSIDRIHVASKEIVDSEYLVQKDNGTLVYYAISSEKPNTYLGDDFIHDAKYFEKVENDNLYYTFDLDNENTPTKLELLSKNLVDESYAKIYLADRINTSHDYLLKISNEAALRSTLLDTMTYYVDMYKRIFETNYSDPFIYNKDDITIDYTLEYENDIYTVSGTIVLDTLTHSNEIPARKMESFKVEFEVSYTNDLVLKNYSKFSYKIDNTPAVLSDDLTELYYITDVTYTRDIHEPHISKIKSIIEAADESIAIPHREELRFHVNGELHTITTVDYNSTINVKVSETIEEIYTAEGLDNFSSIAIYLDKDHTISYDSTKDVYANSFYGTDIYIEITADEGYSLIFTSFLVYFEDIDYKYDLILNIEIVATDHEYTIDLLGPNPLYDSTDPNSEPLAAYDDKITLNEETITSTTFTPTTNEYHINLYYIMSYIQG